MQREVSVGIDRMRSMACLAVLVAIRGRYTDAWDMLGFSWEPKTQESVLRHVTNGETPIKNRGGKLWFGKVSVQGW